jgi:hypothetical protein
MVFHYHVQREELLIVLQGRLSLRSADGREQLPEGRSSPCLAASVDRTGTEMTAPVATADNGLACFCGSRADSICG